MSMPMQNKNSMPEKLAKFLATSGDKEDNMPPSINTRISSEEEMKMFLLADFLGKQDVDSAEQLHKSLCQHAISKRGMGRREVMQTAQRTPSITQTGPSGSYSYNPEEEK